MSDPPFKSHSGSSPGAQIGIPPLGARSRSSASTQETPQETPMAKATTTNVLPLFPAPPVGTPRFEDALASLDETFGEDEFQHWEIVWAERITFERGITKRDPCANWPTEAITSQFLDWYSKMSGEHPNIYPAKIAQRRLRGVYLEFCCRRRARPRDDASVRADIDIYVSRNTTPGPALLPAQAAEEFVRDLRNSGRCGEYNNEALTAAYLEHCRRINRRPTANQALRVALKAIPGVRSDQLNKTDNRGSRHRPTVWVIAPESAEWAHQQSQMSRPIRASAGRRPQAMPRLAA